MYKKILEEVKQGENEFSSMLEEASRQAEETLKKAQAQAMRLTETGVLSEKKRYEEELEKLKTRARAEVDASIKDYAGMLEKKKSGIEKAAEVAAREILGK